MAVSASNLTSGFSTTSGTSFSTASITPSANALILLSIAVRNGASTNPTISSISGNGLTWVLVDSSLYDDNSSSRRKLFVYRAMGASPSTGAITITTGETDTDVTWTVDQFTGVDTGGTNGSAAVVQSANNRINTGGTPASSLTVTLAAFGSTNNATYGAFAEAGTGAGFTVGSGFTQLSYPKTDDSNLSGYSEWKSTNDTTVDINMAGSFDGIGGVAIEIKAGGTAYTQTLSETTTLTDSILKQAQKKLIETITHTDSILKLIAKTFTETQTSTDTLNKQTSKSLSETVTHTDTITTLKVTVKTLLETVTHSDTLTKLTNKVLSETTSLTDSIVRFTQRTLTETLSLTDTVKKLLNGLSTFYSDKFASRGTSYGNKYSSRGTSYGDKLSGKGTSYTDKYSPRDL